jgi:hypothetical protein
MLRGTKKRQFFTRSNRRLCIGGISQSLLEKLKSSMLLFACDAEKIRLFPEDFSHRSLACFGKAAVASFKTRLSRKG